MLHDACRYPQGYSIMFISAQSPVYQGCHWAVYDVSGKFWGYDADEISSDVYDYESDDMPPGCLFKSKDALLEASVPHAPAPSPEAFNKQTAGQAGSQEELLTDCRSLTCRPVAARPLACDLGTTSAWVVAAAIFALVTSTLLIVMILAVTIFPCGVRSHSCSCQSLGSRISMRRKHKHPCSKCT